METSGGMADFDTVDDERQFGSSKNNSLNAEARKIDRKQKWIKLLLDNLILLLMILAIAAGIGIGIALRSLDPPMTSQQIVYLRFPGDLLMRMLKLLILPIITSTIISGVASLGANSGKLGLAAIVYYMITTLSAVLLGILLVSIIQPGVGLNNLEGNRKLMEISNIDSLLDLIRNLFPDNLISAAFEKTKTDVQTSLVTVNTTTGEQQNVTTYAVTTAGGMNVLGIIMFSVAFGAAVGHMEEAGEPVRKFFEVVGEATMKLVYLVMWYSPIGITFLIAKEVVAMDDPINSLRQLGLYMGTVIAGLAIHGLIVLPIVYAVFTRKNPLRFIAGMASALLTAFGTASSSATLPVTLRCLEENNKVDRRVSRFVVPVGATINMDGTALYEAVAGIFIAQLNGIEMDFVKIATTCLTATLASIGAAGVPQAGLVTLIIVIGALGLPSNDIAKILAVDWFLDRCRTTMNVWGDSIGAAVVERICRTSLRRRAEDSYKSANGGYHDNKSFEADDRDVPIKDTSLDEQ